MIPTAAEVGIKGEIQATANDATETWSLDLEPLDTDYALRARPEYVQGNYQKELVRNLAPHARDLMLRILGRAREILPSFASFASLARLRQPSIADPPK